MPIFNDQNKRHVKKNHKTGDIVCQVYTRRKKLFIQVIGVF